MAKQGEFEKKRSNVSGVGYKRGQYHVWNGYNVVPFRDGRVKFEITIWHYHCFRIRDKNYNLFSCPSLEKRLINEVAIFGCGMLL